MNATAKASTPASLDSLIADILDQHHVYLKRAMPRITELLESAQPGSFPGLESLQRLWPEFVEEMDGHLWKEEQILFPMVKSLEAGHIAAAGHCGGVGNPLRVMLYEHESAEAALKTMRQLTDEFRAPAPELAELFQAIEELAADTSLHIHKENDILFPRVLELAG